MAFNAICSGTKIRGLLGSFILPIFALIAISQQLAALRNNSLSLSLK